MKFQPTVTATMHLCLLCGTGQFTTQLYFMECMDNDLKQDIYALWSSAGHIFELLWGSWLPCRFTSESLAEKQQD